VRAELALDVVVERVEVLGLEACHALEAGEGLAGLLVGRLVGWEGAADDERGGEGAGRVREKEGPEEVERRGRREGASGATTVLILSLSLVLLAHSTTTATSHLCRRRRSRSRRGHRAQGPQRRGELAPIGRVVVCGIEVVAVFF